MSPRRTRDVRPIPAIADCRSCSVRILDYHRSGEPYLARVDVAPLGSGVNHVGFVGLARRVEESAKRPRPRGKKKPS
jgi:hypothetical protein